MKYIVLTDGEREYAMVFDKRVVHAMAMPKDDLLLKAVGAGSVTFLPEGLACRGYSESLGVKSRGPLDTVVVRALMSELGK